MIRTLATSLLLALVTTLPLRAGDSFAVPVTGEILGGWQQPDGTRIAAIKLTLAPGWKTYWRAPGDAGIPPAFDWSGSDNLRGVGITWPTPEVFQTAGMRTIGYSGEVVLPLALSPRKAGAPIALTVDLEMGVCSDICVPHRMQMSADLSGSNSKPTPAIAAALAAQPLSEAEAGVRHASCTLRPTADGMEISARLDMASAGGAEVVIIEPGQPGMWMSETTVTRQGDSLTAVGEMIPGAGSTLALDRSAIRFTVLGTKHAVDIRGCKAG